MSPCLLPRYSPLRQIKHKYKRSFRFLIMLMLSFGEKDYDVENDIACLTCRPIVPPFSCSAAQAGASYMIVHVSGNEKGA
jgi:hypothetical protein